MTGINLAVTVGVWCRPLIRHARHKAGHDEERGSAFQRHPELPPRISLSLHPGLRITRAAGELFQKKHAPLKHLSHTGVRVFLPLPVVLSVGWCFTKQGMRHGEAHVPVPVFAIVFLVLCVVNSAMPLTPSLL